jgi:hypothetical protein
MLLPLLLHSAMTPIATDVVSMRAPIMHTKLYTKVYVTLLLCLHCWRDTITLAALLYM